MIKHLSIWDFQHPDIVSILAYCVYSGTCSQPNKMFFSGHSINRIRPILSKYFYVTQYERPTAIKNISTVERRTYITSTEFVQKAIQNGWKFRLKDKNNIPKYVFEDINLFRVVLSILLDTRAYLSFEYGQINRKITMTMESSNIDEWVSICRYLKKYNLPIGHQNYLEDNKLKSGIRSIIKWYGAEIYQLLDFIGWDLQRPWNVSMIKYMLENREARSTPKSRFL